MLIAVCIFINNISNRSFHIQRESESYTLHHILTYIVVKHEAGTV